MALYNIADLLVQMEVSGRTAAQAAPYKIQQGTADITLCYDTAKTLELNPQYENLEQAEYMASGACFARLLLENNGFQLHASSVILNGKAYLFSAPSGTGKSTHTEKWVRLFGAKYLNDDKPAVRLTKDGWMAYGTPWSGKHDLSNPEKAQLGAVAFVNRGEQNTICRLTPQEAVPYFISQLLRYINADQMVLQLELLDRLLETVPVFLLTCRNDDEAAFVARKAMEDGND